MYIHTEENKPIPHTYPYSFCPNLRKPKMSPFNSAYLTQNYDSKYGKTSLSNQWRHLLFIKWKYNNNSYFSISISFQLDKLNIKQKNNIKRTLQK